MAKDYFSDIYTNEPDPPRRRPNTENTNPPAPASAAPTPVSSEKSIRNISVPSRRATSPRIGGGDIRVDRSPEMPGTTHSSTTPERPKSRARVWVWVAAGISVLVLILAVSLILWSDTTVTVTPRTHHITFDPSTQFTAYPENSASAGTIAYRVETTTFEDSETVPATGTEKAQDLASGTITVYNEYSTSPVRLIKNTRFESPDGKIFRIPASIEVPGKKDATPGQITITVFADQPGSEYNLGPVDKFTLPGLKSTADMYAGVYGRSTAAFSGGFVGDKPAVAPQALDAARTKIRERLKTKAEEATASIANGFAFPSLIKVAYESLPTTPDPSGGARVNEKITVQIPVFPTDNFARSIAQAVSADASESTVTLKPQNVFGGRPTGELPETLGESPLVFTLEGAATIVWDVQAQSLAEALAGREQAAFETIIGSFPGVERANANIAPFWSSTFPKNTADIKVEIVEPSQP